MFKLLTYSYKCVTIPHMPDNNQPIPHPVRRLRSRKGWNRERLSVEAGVGKSAVDALEQGKPVSDKLLAKIAAALGLTIDELESEIGHWREGNPVSR